MSTQALSDIPTNRIPAEAFDELRSTRLAIAERLICRLPAGTRQSAAARIHAMVADLQADLGLAPGTAADLTIASPALTPVSGDAVHADFIVIEVDGGAVSSPLLPAVDGAPFAPEFLSGSYRTELYKGLSATTRRGLDERAGEVLGPLVLEVMIELLHEELAIVAGGARPVLACRGRASEAPIRTHFEPLGYEVVYLPHIDDVAVDAQGPAPSVPAEEHRLAITLLNEAVSRARQAQLV